MTTDKPLIFPAWLRIMHWLNAVAVILLIMSGWQIYNATAFMGFNFSKNITLGGWLGGAIQWHFAAMWLLFFNGVLYLIFNIVTKRLFSKFFPLSPKTIFSDMLAALKGKLSHDDPKKYNAVQKASYLFVMIDITVLIISGLVLWKSVQFPILRELLGGYETARRVHFFAMALMVGFIGVHLVMVVLVPRTFIYMVRGR
jgi:thiosulfate reductase cytochrome b subunit